MFSLFIYLYMLIFISYILTFDLYFFYLFSYLHIYVYIYYKLIFYTNNEKNVSNKSTKLGAGWKNLCLLYDFKEGDKIGLEA